MLLRLLRTYLGRYRKPLVLVVIFQAIQAMAALFLPRLNAEIIDNGVLRGDTGYIWRHGRLMIGVTLVQIFARRRRRLLRLRGGDGLRPRRARADCSTTSPTSPPGR